MWPFSLFKQKAPPKDLWAAVAEQRRAHPDEYAEEYGRQLQKQGFTAEEVHAMTSAYRREIVSGPDRTDYLANAATLGARAKEAVSQARYDDAWRLYHEQKAQYWGHAQRYGMTARQTVALDGSVHEHLANIRRLEGKHADAFTHLLYCVVASEPATKAQEKKLVSYFNRCHFRTVNLAEVNAVRARLSEKPDFAAIQDTVVTWTRS